MGDLDNDPKMIREFIVGKIGEPQPRRKAQPIDALHKVDRLAPIPRPEFLPIEKIDYLQRLEVARGLSRTQISKYKLIIEAYFLLTAGKTLAFVQDWLHQLVGGTPAGQAAAA